VVGRVEIIGYGMFFGWVLVPLCGSLQLLPRGGVEARVMSMQALTGDEIRELCHKRAPRYDVTSQVMEERYLGTTYIAASEKAGGARVGNVETRS
jgi:hypothetical protein